MPDTLPAHMIKVENLINKPSHTWDKTTLDQFCLPINRDRILQIILAPIFEQDKFVWLPIQDGEFSFKKAYWFVFHLYSFNRDCPRTLGDITPHQHFWKQVWSSQILPRLSH